MKRTIEFKIDCIPPKSTHQAGMRIMKRRDGSQFVGKYETGKSKQVQRELTYFFQEYKPDTPLEGALRLSVKWVYPYRKAEPKKNQDAPKWCDTRPDCDNLVKGINDIMGRLGYYTDDGQIAHLDFQKMWAKDFGIYIKLKELT